MHCSHEGTNRTLDESPLCHVVPCRAVSTLRGANARGAECGSSQRLPHVNLMRTPVVLIVVPCRVFSTLRRMKARYAECGSGQRGSVRRSCSCRFSVVRVCLNVAVYQSSRPTRRCSGRASRHEIAAFSEDHFVQHFLSFPTARR